MKFKRILIVSLKIWASSALSGGLVAGLLAILIVGLKMAFVATLMISLYALVLSLPSLILFTVSLRAIWDNVSEEHTAQVSGVVAGVIAAINFLGFMIWPGRSTEDWQFWNYGENIFGVFIFFCIAFISTRFWVQKEIDAPYNNWTSPYQRDY